ncbi:hypothetical protein HY383_03760 [Candidatus Daviesbacteria bacterium]|nr:hypothetical protein [Candidatus Daviesbacteria bacterium]
MSMRETGQSLLEVVTASAVGILVVAALTYATIFSLRNATFAKNSAQATKLAQEGIEKVRSSRDRNSSISGSFTLNSQTIDNWQDTDLWTNQISPNCTPNCYFKFSGSSFQFSTAANNIPNNAEDPLSDGKFKRVVILSDDSTTYTTQKTVTVIVQWTDFAGPHQSKLTTILRKL